MTASRRGFCAVYISAAILICCVLAGLRLSLPDDIADYVSNGFLLPVFRYGILFALIACGVVLSSERRPIVLIAHLAVLALALWFGLQRAEPLILSYEPLAELIVWYPVITTAMALTSGVALLMPLRARRWFVPFVSATCGLCLGVFMILESPTDYYAGWYSWAGGVGGMSVVVASIALADGAQRFWPGSWLVITGRILGSWLIAASLMLGALAIVQKRPLQSTPMPTIKPEGIDLPQQP